MRQGNLSAKFKILSVFMRENLDVRFAFFSLLVCENFVPKFQNLNLNFSSKKERA